MADGELEALLALDGASFEMAPGVIVEFTARRTDATPERPHGLSYAFVLRDKSGGSPWVRFDNAHAVEKPGRGYGWGAARLTETSGCGKFHCNWRFRNDV